ncbi:MAG: transcription elongation factor GreA [Armatimonadota bacterium]|nr:transcription elongation factor GreA [Armatimonadota bacterium]
MQTDKEILLTASGLKKIELELEELRSVHRKRVADRIRDSKQFGEFSENSEYEDAKTEQAFVEGRIEELKQVLMHAAVIDEADVMTDVVGVGSIVKVRDLENSDEWEFFIVGSVEANPGEDKISNESPVGEALMGRKVGNTVEVEIPAGLARYQVVSIRK